MSFYFHGGDAFWATIILVFVLPLLLISGFIYIANWLIDKIPAEKNNDKEKQ